MTGDNTPKKQGLSPAWQSGQSGNPTGRPKGSRNKLGEAFLDALHEDFQAHGVDAIQKVRAEKPDQYLKVIASILPKDLNVNFNNMEALTDDELVKQLRELDSIIRPFLAAQTESGDSGGDSAPTAH